MNSNEEPQVPDQLDEGPTNTSDEIETIMIVFPSARQGLQTVTVEALMERSENLSSLSFDFAYRLRNTRGVSIDIDCGSVVRLQWQLQWRSEIPGQATIVTPGPRHQSNFEIVADMSDNVVLGAADCELVDEDREMLEDPRGINSFFCPTSPELKKQQAANVAAEQQATDAEIARVIQAMNEMDRKKKQKLSQQQGQGSTGQPESSNAGS